MTGQAARSSSGTKLNEAVNPPISVPGRSGPRPGAPLAAVMDCGYAIDRGRKSDFAVKALPKECFMSTSTLIVLAVIVVLILWAITVYNSLISLRQRVNQALAAIDVQLNPGHDLVPN